MSKKQMTLVYYHVPEDKDDPNTPNVFGIMVNKPNIRLQHIYDHFPLKGSYIFRFKVMYDDTIAWIDLPELDSKLPTFKQKIMIKATRVSWQTNKSNPCWHYKFVKGQPASNQNTKNIENNSKTAQVSHQKRPEPPKKSSNHTNLLDDFQSSQQQRSNKEIDDLI